MGRLVEGRFPQIFNGVSRQPHSVRFPGQVEDAENVVFSVETGGFHKRLGTRIKKKITGLATGEKHRLHIINRDANERYRVVLSEGGLRVFDQDYVERTVTADASNLAWLEDDPEDFVLLSALDYTFIVKRTQVVEMDPDVADPAPSALVLYVAAVPDISAASTYKVSINGVEKASYAASISTDDTAKIATELASDLTTGLGAGWTVSRSGSYVFVKKNDGAAFTVSTDSPRGDTSLVVYKDTVGDTSKAPARALHGMMLNVKGVYGPGFWIKFVASDGVSGDGYWTEAAEPGSQVKFKADTMPRALVRNADGTFTLDVVEWAEKSVGGEEDVPNPDFVGETIKDLVFVRNRLGIVAGETVYFSRAGDYFNFWPETSTELLDTDPFGLTNTSNSVSRFYFAIPFRRSTFIMGDTAQFEIGGALLTPSVASIDLATSYSASTRCRPVNVGDELYFVAETGNSASIMSYVFEEATVSETANDVTKHISGYIPAPVVELAGDPIRGQIAVLSDTDRSRPAVHKFYYQGDERVQSAWSKYHFAGAEVLSMGMLDGVLILLMEWRGAVWLMELPTVEDIYLDYDWVPRLDGHQFLTGTYDPGSNTTTWALGYEAESPVAITSNLWPEGRRMLSIPLTVDGEDVVANGDWSDHPMLIGENFEAWVELSKQFLRDENGSAITSGRLQLRRMGLRYTDTGYFTVDVTPYARDTQRWTFSGRRLGSADNQVQRFTLASGNFRFGVGSHAEHVSIRIGSDKFMPFSIVSGVWAGFFNEITRQG